MGGVSLLMSTLLRSKYAKAMRIAVASESFGAVQEAESAGGAFAAGSAAISSGTPPRASTAMIVARRCMCGLTVKLRGRTEAPALGAEGAQFLSARGAKQEALHGPLQRLLDGIAFNSSMYLD